MKLVMIGGHTRNIGKSSVIEGIIRAVPEFNWTAAKITQVGHGVCSVTGEACGCAVSEHQFSITEERHKDTGTARRHRPRILLCNQGALIVECQRTGKNKNLWPPA